MPYSSSEIFSLFTSYLGPTPVAFDPHHLPEIFEPIMLALLKAYLADPHDIPARQAAFKTTLETFTPHQMRTFDAYLYDGSIQHYANIHGFGLGQKTILRALFEIAPASYSEIFDYSGADRGNTHRQLQALVKKGLVRRTPRESTIYYHLSPTYFIVKNPFPNSLTHLDPHSLLGQLQCQNADYSQTNERSEFILLKQPQSELTK